ncbi:MAG: FKBP-type peptidyl-prolyl cis-trans isomerase [Sphingomonadaceae bacterium]|uniref:FKBP-type peptidyl-prolyl cis-trans isomerase n=1 Tax=Thermaurantiacus sp. TaxID=2820283 RepID=UPI00298F05FA|nr:FKBP-type peptidyl-prolyl cis-trans isomerase [Thermaurantiacus sp.]MCS6986503.1 FKBP-type peptidyl-prolyl cis-trans isomerase [Sphingomonadaceae bacterium]MDW8414236.1 FKBP-type peptidyl-prolyl cis-trans isomerase [Thermaurantiacus sp.]
MTRARAVGAVGPWILAGVVGVAAMVALAWAGTRELRAEARRVAAVLDANARRPGVKVLPSGLQFEELRRGSGASPTSGDTVLVNYEGRLADGTVFDSSYATGQPAAFPVDGLIPGLAEGLRLMKPGGAYRILIPPALAYGPKGAGGVIPPNAVLDFRVELLAVAPGGAARGE